MKLKSILLAIAAFSIFSASAVFAKDPAIKITVPASAAITKETMHQSLIGAYRLHLSKDVPAGAILTKDDGSTTFGTLIPAEILSQLKSDATYSASVTFIGGKLITEISTTNGASIGKIGDTHVGLRSSDSLSAASASPAAKQTKA